MKIAVFQYSQTGQAREVSEQLFETIRSVSEQGSSSVEVIYKAIEPDHQYPYPWDKFDFFDVFPETRLGITLSGIRPIDFSDIADADLVVVVGQSWFLSPSQPIQSFFTDESVKHYLQGRKVVFVNVCRNMWLMTYRKVKAYLQKAKAEMIGHIVLQDRNSNLVSVLTIVRWLMYGGKESSMMLPRAGVSDQDIHASSRFGQVIVQTLQEGTLQQLQERLLEVGAIEYKPSILFLENTGHKIFGFWAKFIRRKGAFGDKRRYVRLDLFFYYLLFVLFVVSPFAQLFFYITYPFRSVKRQKRNVCLLLD